MPRSFSLIPAKAFPRPCLSCNSLLESEAFGKNKRYTDEKHIYCKNCVNSKKKLSNKITPPEGMSRCGKCSSLLSHASFSKDSSKPTGRASFCKPCHNLWKKNKRNSPMHRLHMKYKTLLYSSKSRSLFNNISEEAYLALAILACAYCGGLSDGGLDRVDTARGYSADNVVPCCAICNRIKLNHDLTFLKTHLKRMVIHLGLA